MRIRSQQALLVLAVAGVAVMAAWSPLSARAVENDRLRLLLGHDRQGFPCIKGLEWRSTHRAIFKHQDAPTAVALPWLPEAGSNDPAPARAGEWKVSPDSIFIHATCERRLRHLLVRWHVQLMRHEELFRVHVELVADSALAVEWFPVWSFSWNRQGQPPLLKSWQALSYQPQQQEWSAPARTVLGSNRYSSDGEEEDGENSGRLGQLPFWQLEDGAHRLGFSLAWCGGWRAELSVNASATNLRTWLPPAETQLKLGAGESMHGPALTVYVQKKGEERYDRAAWFSQRQALAQALYPQPAASFPLIYNHWYSVRFKLDGDFITSQARAVQELGFDVFVVDAGWYDSVGDWTPSRSKFRAGEFEQALAEVRRFGIATGLWSCPWLVAVQGNTLPPQVDRPGLYREFMQAYALDLAGSHFSEQLLDHIRHLYQDYGMRWWKYDQEFLGEQTRQGAMKNMLALQNSLTAVRRHFPDLVIENCMSGGRMINEFTDAISSMHWIRDGSRNGLQHLRSNVVEALGAAQLLPLHKVQRWTNRIDEIADENLLRDYCRSAMIGSWGVSADLRKLSTAQKAQLLTLVAHYRTLNGYKRSNIFEIGFSAARQYAAITYVNASADSAAVLAFRLGETNETGQELPVRGLKSLARYRITDVDTGAEMFRTGKECAEKGWRVDWPGHRRSGLYYLVIDPAGSR